MIVTGGAGVVMPNDEAWCSGVGRVETGVGVHFRDWRHGGVRHAVDENGEAGGATGQDWGEWAAAYEGAVGRADQTGEKSQPVGVGV